MKQTNDKAIIRLMHMPTGNYVDWEISSHAVPAVNYIQSRVEKKREQLDTYIDEHDIDLKDKNADTDPDQVIEISRMNGEIISLKMDALACILEPKQDLPDGTDKREYLEECIGSYEMITEIMNFFSEHFVSTIKSHGRSRPLLQILDEKGNPWQEENTKDSKEETSSTG